MMSLASTVKRWLFLAVAASLLAAQPAAAEGRTPLPVVPEAKGDQCVQDPHLMRMKHMDFLRHQRDDTLRRGIRGGEFSLKECLDCHVPPASERKVEFGSDQHFCSSCHNYAAVKIDCFSCHASQPSGE